MPQPQFGVLLRHLHRVPGSSSGGPTDHQLLECFAHRRDEAAFEELMRRHGPMVVGVCRRLLNAGPDADDVFQATFLVLVHKAASIRQGSSLGGWLYGVASRLALKARAGAARRRVHERRVAEMRQTEATNEIFSDDIRPALDEELARLPERLRAPLVLCYLQGKTNTEAALKAALAGDPSAELRRRVENLLERARTSADSGERLRQARALEAAEAMRTPDAGALLEDVAKGAADAWLTREAKAALARSGKR